MNSESEIPVTDYILSVDGVMMYRWKYCHLMEESSNPVEICMKELKSSRYGLKPCREATMINKVRYLIRWMYERVETRYRALNHENGIAITSGFKVPCKWVEKYIVDLCHEYQEYQAQFEISDSTGNRDVVTTTRLHLFDVYDIPHETVYVVDTLDHTCTCHIPYWKKVPCLHVIAVLSLRNEFDRVWEFVGDEYRQCTIMQTCRRLTKDEKEVLDSILPESSAMIPSLVEGFDGFRNKRGRTVKNPRRITSRGEE